MQQLERLRTSLTLFKIRGRENPRRGEIVEDPETRLSMDLRQDIEQLLEIRGRKIIDPFEIFTQLIVPISAARCIKHGISPIDLVRRMELKLDKEDDDRSVKVYIDSFGVNPEKSKWIFIQVSDRKEHLSLPRYSRGEIRRKGLTTRGGYDYLLRKATADDLLFYRNAASSIGQARTK